MNETTSGASTAPASDADAAQPETVLSPTERIAQLETALEAAKAESAAHWEKYLRERADMENYKKRIERTYADLSKRGRKDLLLKLLGAVDNLERAISYESDSSREVDGRNLLKGLKMTHLQFKELLSGEGLTEIKTAGERFDPMRHEAVITEAAPGKSEGEILSEIQKGYTIGDELLRPAQVKVASA